MHQHDRDRPQSLRVHALQIGSHDGFVQRLDHLAAGADALRHLAHGGLQQLGQDDVEGEEVRPVLVADAQDVAETARDEQRRGLALALEQRVGRDGGAHLDRPDALARNGRVARDAQQVEEVDDLTALWRDDLVILVLGCSFSFEWPLAEAGLRMRHMEQGRHVAMHVTSMETVPAGSFGGPMVVSMRPFRPADASRAIRVSSRFPAGHGAPIHFGDPAAIGIRDVEHRDSGDFTGIEPGEVPVIWAGGVTPQSAIRAAPSARLRRPSPGARVRSASRAWSDRTMQALASMSCVGPRVPSRVPATSGTAPAAGAHRAGSLPTTLVRIGSRTRPARMHDTTGRCT